MEVFFVTTSFALAQIGTCVPPQQTQKPSPFGLSGKLFISVLTSGWTARIFISVDADQDYDRQTGEGYTNSNEYNEASVHDCEINRWLILAISGRDPHDLDRDRDGIPCEALR